MTTATLRGRAAAHLFRSSRFWRTMLFEAPVASSTLLKVLLNPASPRACRIDCTCDHTALQVVHHDMQCMPTGANGPSRGRAIALAGMYNYANDHWGMPCTLGQSRLKLNAVHACKPHSIAQSCTSCRYIAAYVNAEVVVE